MVTAVAMPMVPVINETIYFSTNMPVWESIV
jgi:hypothetical protein